MTALVARANWAGNVRFSASDFHRPTTVGELQDLVAGSQRVRALGTGHSFSDIADTSGDLVSVAGLPQEIDIDAERRSVRVNAGTRYGELGMFLQTAGFALPNTGSLPHISVAGASATGTHGSGNANGNLASIVSAIDIVTADGDLVSLSRETEGDRFNGMVLALGSLGIVTTLTLDIVPTFHVRQDIYDDLPHETLIANFEEISGSGYSVSVFSTWKAPRTHHIWRKRIAEAGDTTAAASTWLTAALATATRNPIGPGWPAENVTEQMGIPGPWNERLPHFRLDFTPSYGEELQSEFLLPRSLAAQALEALDDIAERVSAVLQVSELRTVAADELWISPSYHQDSVCLHFTWLFDPAGVSTVVSKIEDRLQEFGARPHWGKIFNLSAEKIRPLYERLPDFVNLLIGYDPSGKFRNAMTTRLFFG